MSITIGTSSHYERRSDYIPVITRGDQTTFQSLQEEIRLHCHLQHKNIVSYYGTLAENGVFKVFMEQVPGGEYDIILYVI